MQFVGINYKWGGDDTILGFDCSGFAQEIMAAFGVDPKGDQTAQGLLNHFRTSKKGTRLKTPCVGALAFFGFNEAKITHVGICLDSVTMIEAGGGNSRTVDSKAAARQNAYIRLRPIRGRKDLATLILPNYI